MTPEQLRIRARKYIESARKLIDSDPDLAAQTVGYAVEFTLKARLCTRKGWKDFPDSPKEVKQRGFPDRLHIHDLEMLLKYTADISIKTSSMQKVNWERASDWSVDQRYTPIGTVTREKAGMQIDETEKLYDELLRWEILGKLLEVEKEQAQKRGPFNFFGLVQDAEAGGWTVWFAAWGTPAGVKQRHGATVNAVTNALDADLRATLRGIRSLHPLTPVLQSCYAMLPPIQHVPRCITRNNLVAGLPVMPPAYIISCKKLIESSVLNHIASFPLHEEIAVLPKTEGQTDGARSLDA